VSVAQGEAFSHKSEGKRVCLFKIREGKDYIYYI
jgi:hypothetical protein